MLRNGHSSVRIPTSCAGIALTTSRSEGDRIMTLQLHQERNFPADAPQLGPREMTPLRAISADSDQYLELRGEAAQRRGVCRKETPDQALFVG